MADRYFYPVKPFYQTFANDYLASKTRKDHNSVWFVQVNHLLLSKSYWKNFGRANWLLARTNRLFFRAKRTSGKIQRLQFVAPSWYFLLLFRIIWRTSFSNKTRAAHVFKERFIHVYLRSVFSFAIKASFFRSRWACVARVNGQGAARGKKNSFRTPSLCCGG